MKKDTWFFIVNAIAGIGKTGRLLSRTQLSDKFHFDQSNKIKLDLYPKWNTLF